MSSRFDNKEVVNLTLKKAFNGSALPLSVQNVANKHGADVYNMQQTGQLLVDEAERIKQDGTMLQKAWATVSLPLFRFAAKSMTPDVGAGNFVVVLDKGKKDAFVSDLQNTPDARDCIDTLRVGVKKLDL